MQYSETLQEWTCSKTAPEFGDTKNRRFCYFMHQYNCCYYWRNLSWWFSSMRKHSAVLHIQRLLELSSKAVSYCLMKIIDVLTSINAMHQYGSSKLSNLLTLRAMEVQCVIASLSAHSVRWPLPNQSGVADQSHTNCKYESSISNISIDIFATSLTL